MEGIKVVPPWPSMILFYYYYSYFIMILCWILTPIVFYIVFTQSKALKNFKWLILNHLFWCLALETLVAFIKPLFLFPAPAGYQIGIFRHSGDFRHTSISAIICFAIAGNCVIGLTATIGSRYMLVFPSPLTEWFNLKIVGIAMVLFSSLIYLILGYAFFPLMQIDSQQIQQWTTEYDPFLETYFMNEPTFCFLPKSLAQTPAFVVLGLIIFLASITGIFVLFFAYQAFQFKSMTAAKLKYSLILSSIVQIFITGFLLVLPVFLFFVFIAFNIRKTATSSCAFMCILMSHCLVEYLATLYFIQPYRKFIVKIFREKVLPKKRKASVASLSFISDYYQVY